MTWQSENIIKWGQNLISVCSFGKLDDDDDDDDVDINRTWESIRDNMKASATEQSRLWVETA